MARKRLLELAREARDTGQFMELAKAYNTECMELIETVLAKHVAGMFAVLCERENERAQQEVPGHG
ncbi:MAG: hypothetical protein GAK28_03179 [Luteibacter sp.]|nr:MAG: hypothetical protein GAK28_03179 [Luteibacter sp.]